MNVMPDFRYCRPNTLAEAVGLRATYPDAQVMAGGTDFVVNMRRGLAGPSAVIDLSAIGELATITEVNGGIRIGAAVTLSALAGHDLVCQDFPALVTAAQSVAGPTHRAAATVGGNLCQDTRCAFYNQSEWWRSANGYCLKRMGDTCHVVVKKNQCYATYHGDLAPVLMVLGADVELLGPAGKRRLPVAALFHDDGASHLTLLPGEVVAALVVPAQAGAISGYAKTRIRNSIDFPLAAVAVALSRDGDRIGSLRLAITGVNSAPQLVPTAELVGQPWNGSAAEAIAKGIRQASSAVKTTTVGPAYRRRVLLATARQLVDQLWAKAA